MKTGFYLDNPKKNISAIRAIIRYKGQRYTISTGESVITKYWNENKYRCRTSREYPEAIHINTRLDDWANLIEDAINSFGLITPTNQMLKNKIVDIIRDRNIEAGGIIKNEPEQYFINFAIKYCEESNKSNNTKKVYQTTIKNLLSLRTSLKSNFVFPILILTSIIGSMVGYLIAHILNVEKVFTTQKTISDVFLNA